MLSKNLGGLFMFVSELHIIKLLPVCMSVIGFLGRCGQTRPYALSGRTRRVLNILRWDPSTICWGSCSESHGDLKRQRFESRADASKLLRDGCCLAQARALSEC